MTVTPFECPAEWTNECGCPDSHNYCWPEPLVSCCPELQTGPDTPPETVAIVEQSKRVAVQILHSFSGRQFGLCRRVVRPCLDDCREGGPVATAWVDGQLRPTLDGGAWYNRDVCGKCKATGCGCAAICEVTLPGLVQRIVQVKQDGVTLDPGQYRVDNHRKLVRLPLVRVTSGLFSDCTPDIPNAVCVVTPSGDQMQVGGNDFDISMGGQEFTLLTGVPFSVVFGRGRRSPQVTMQLCPGAVVTWTNAVATSVTADATLAAQSLTGFTVGGVQTNVTVTFPSAVLPNDTTTPDFTITGPPGCAKMLLGAMSYLDTGEACWPKCQDLSAADTEPNTFSVEYLRGVPVPEGGRWAAGMFACELVKACLPDTGECRLPDNVKTVAREGVTMELAPFIIGGADGQIDFGRTGVPEVDTWLIAVNPHKARTRSRAYSPDRPNPRRQTWPCP